MTARRPLSLLRQLRAVLGPERVAWQADQTRIRFQAAGYTSGAEPCRVAGPISLAALAWSYDNPGSAPPGR